MVCSTADDGGMLQPEQNSDESSWLVENGRSPCKGYVNVQQ
jgi:hypothetical protein